MLIFAKNLPMFILQPGERFVYAVPANLFQGLIAMGGHLTVTDRRLHFKPHDFNIGAHAQDIFFEHITGITKGKTLGLIPNVIYVQTPMARYKFVPQKRNVTFDVIEKALAEFRAKG